MRSRLGTKSRLAAHLTALVLLIVMLVYMTSPQPPVLPPPQPAAIALPTPTEPTQPSEPALPAPVVAAVETPATQPSIIVPDEQPIENEPIGITSGKAEPETQSTGTTASQTAAPGELRPPGSSEPESEPSVAVPTEPDPEPTEPETVIDSEPAIETAPADGAMPLPVPVDESVPEIPVESTPVEDSDTEPPVAPSAEPEPALEVQATVPTETVPVELDTDEEIPEELAIEADTSAVHPMADEIPTLPDQDGGEEASLVEPVTEPFAGTDSVGEPATERLPEETTPPAAGNADANAPAPVLIETEPVTPPTILNDEGIMEIPDDDELRQSVIGAALDNPPVDFVPEVEQATTNGDENETPPENEDPSTTSGVQGSDEAETAPVPTETVPPTMQPDESGSLVVAGPETGDPGSKPALPLPGGANLEVLDDGVYWLDSRHDLERELSAIPETGTLVLLVPVPGYRAKGTDHIRSEDIPADITDLSADAAERFIHFLDTGRKPVVAAAIPEARGAVFFKGAYLLARRNMDFTEMLREIDNELEKAGQSREEIVHRLLRLDLDSLR